MKLLTHNMLTSHVKGVKNGFPLRILARKVEVRQIDFNPNFITRMIPRIDWSVLRAAAENLGHGQGLPESPPEEYESQEDFLKSAHHVLMEVEVLEGDLECPESGRKFPVTEGIPNMLLREDEV
ncbi:Multifunctional methyltransferase subunit TRM112-like protein [Geodia barretti]|uniref:Multifunctional methyltransferase subunit TRM112-like protein n=1 Tax=Geodia barretti TaxID=519541 RepID=A0AA35TWI5_GEOBA|nr:Multifunctional methyltransferase subunit TRM112-like protein [Geodia barretti]